MYLQDGSPSTEEIRRIGEEIIQTIRFSNCLKYLKN